MKVVFASLLVLVVLNQGVVPPKDQNTVLMKQESVWVRGKIIVGSQTFEVSYYDNPTSRSLVEQMPFSANLEDYARTEKIFHPEKALDKREAPEGAAPFKGDMMLYAPWGNVAIFYKDFQYARGLVPIGHIGDVSGFVEALGEQGPKVTFEL